MVYIQRRDNQTNQLETIDEFTNYKEAFLMVREYTLSDPSGSYYASQRACKGWTK